VARPIVWWAVGPWVYLVRVFRFVCVLFFMKVNGFSLVVQGTVIAVPDKNYYVMTMVIFMTRR
jgi:hypothetical protein